MDIDRNGPLSRVTNFVYRLLIIELGFVLATAPALIGIFLLEPDASNIPLYAVCALLFGPAITAGVYAWRTDHDVVPWLRFWKGWVDGLGQSLMIWVPAVALLGLAAFNAAYAQVGIGFIVAGIVLGVAGVIAAVTALVVIANFSFRSRDLFKVALYGAASAPLAALGIISMIVLTGGLIVVVSDWLPVFLASFLLLLLARTVTPMLHQIQSDLVVTPS
ncbi:hypothetical protein I2485_10575 [Nesterenkonia sp. E16_7]|uniref:hypothetical protein n=1 Tax=unclassified Nesterenkonia TaxID=2629769 RepID=UPI001A913EEE|nr:MULTISPECIES: hypothetical protein [unclassified Nesterenkonia]MBO0595464.1 hypothetical protein [Nesterenkonia sp. E16_10]MBO0599088.1 hypothetical protein [Nesterenkonia sp. E16_7]